MSLPAHPLRATKCRSHGRSGLFFGALSVLPPHLCGGTNTLLER